MSLQARAALNDVLLSVYCEFRIALSVTEIYILSWPMLVSALLPTILWSRQCSRSAQCVCSSVCLHDKCRASWTLTSTSGVVVHKGKVFLFRLKAKVWNWENQFP